MFDRFFIKLLPIQRNNNLTKIKLALGIAFLAILGACQSNNLEQPSITVPETETPTSLPPKDPRVTLLLDQAYFAYNQDRLTTPIENNAYLKYLQVLSIDNKNAAANQGISEIVEKYLAWAMDAAEAQNYRKAWSYVTKANSVDENHANIQSVSTLIKKRQLTKHVNFALLGSMLDKRGESITTELQKIALFIEQHNGAIAITARSDKEGRWIYQQLNAATQNRIRATFKLNSIPKVRVSYQ
ncbi:MAG: hypothetical protein ACI9FB_002525 [Candidatus Azotimanducaceae bacterium]|jgi:hypothetical protein